MLTINKNHEEKLKKYLKVKDTSGIHEQKLWEKVNKYKKLFQYIPGVLCVCVGNSLAMNTAHKSSDIDLFIITRENRIWVSRIYFTIILMLLRERKTAKKHAGKFCLSFFITENHLSLEDIAIKDDVYLKYWIETLVPIIDKNNTFERFIGINTVFFSLNKEKIEIVPVQKNTFCHRFFTVLGDICEKVLKTIFLPRTKRSFQTLGKPFGVIIRDDILKFHDQDKRKEIRNTIFY